MQKKNTIKIVSAIVLMIVIIFGVNLLKGRIDLTEEKRFTLNPSTDTMLDQLSQKVHIQVFLTGDLTPDYNKLRQATTDLLEELKDKSHDQIEYDFVELGKGLDDSTKSQLYDSMARQGVVFENTQKVSDDNNAQTSQLIIPSALVTVDGKQPLAVDLRSSRTIFKTYNIVNDNPEPDKEATLNSAEALLEYKFANAIHLLTRTKIPKVAYLVGNGEPIDMTVNDLGENVRRVYQLGILDLKTQYPDPKNIDALMIVKPTTAFTEQDKQKLDQYVMQGGKILWFVDKLYAELDSLMRKQSDFIAYDRGLELDDILFKYGVRINGDLVQDLNCAKLPIVIGYNPDHSPRLQRMPWPYYPFLSADNHNPISRNMDRVLSIFPESIDTLPNPNIHKTILLATDTNSRSLSSPALVSLNSWQDDPDFKTFHKAHIPVAVLLEGIFPSLYAHRMTEAQKDSLETHLGASIQEESKPTQQIVVSNAGIFTNQVMQTNGPLPMGTLPFDDYQFANKDFLMNSLDYLLSDNKIYEAKNKDFILRLLDKQKIKDQKSTWLLVNIALPILLIIIFGFGFQYFRKKKYSA